MGRFVISLDCEGKWGMADGLQPYHHALMTDRAVADVYDRLVAMFGRYDMAATFAYVMAFTLTPEEREAFPILRRRPDGWSDPWLDHYWAHQEAGRTEGWFVPHALDAVRADGRHEIACHSFCHRPMGDHSLSDEGARAELGAAAEVAAMKGLSLSTFIFPRNDVGNLRALSAAGYAGYREKLARPLGALGRGARLLEEFNLHPHQQPALRAAPGEMVRIPAGYFFNWRFGARRYVPEAITVRRWKNLLDRAAAEGGVAHLWLHPHNLITAPATGASLERVLRHAADLRDRGRLTVQTQDGYCRDLAGRAPVAGR